MAVQNFYNAYFLVNSINLSDHVKSIKFDSKVDTLEVTAMSNPEHRFIQGLKDITFEVTMYQDYASGSVDATLNTLLTAGAVAFETRPDAGAVAVTNPKWTGNLIFEGYEPISGSVGTVQEISAKFRPAGAITRATA